MRKLFTVSDSFVLEGQGTVLMAKFEDEAAVFVGDTLELRLPDDTTVRVSVAGLDCPRIEPAPAEPSLAVALSADLGKLPTGSVGYLASIDRSNPFATRFIRPGALEYIFRAGVSAESIVDDLEKNYWKGAIIGPHGTGKSSLLATLKPALEKRGRQIIQQQLQGGQRSLDWKTLNDAAWEPRTLVILDGYEQLSLWQRLLLRARCFLRGAGLLVTAHQPVQLPTIFTTQPTVDLAQQIVQKLLPAGDERVTAGDVAATFAEHQGNIRETLLQLYDVYRSRQ